MFDPTVSEALVGPFSLVDKGLSYLKLGELVHELKKTSKPGRYLVQGGIGEYFAIVLYEDLSWRVSTPQIPIWDTPATPSPHTLT